MIQRNRIPKLRRYVSSKTSVSTLMMISISDFLFLWPAFMRVLYYFCSRYEKITLLIMKLFLWCEACAGGAYASLTLHIHVFTVCVVMNLTQSYIRAVLNRENIERWKWIVCKFVDKQ